MNNKGYILFIGLWIATVLFIFLTILTTKVFIQRRQVDYSYHREKAFALAESGVDAGLATLNQISPSSPFTLSGSIEGMGTFTVEVVNSTTEATITSTGIVNRGSTQIRRTVRVQAIDLAALIFDAAVIGVTGVKVSGTGYIDGDVVVGSGGETPDPDKVSGEIRELDIPMELPKVPPPSGPFDFEDDKLTEDDSPISSGGTYRFGSMQISSNKVLEITATDAPVIIYIDGNVNINGEVRIASGSTVTLYVSGNTSIAGQGIVNESGDPSKFVLYGYSKCDFTSENINFYGAVYAPEISIKVTGGLIQGCLVGNTVSVGGGGEVRYDPRVKNIHIPDVPKFVFAPGSWEEIKNF